MMIGKITRCSFAMVILVSVWQRRSPPSANSCTSQGNRIERCLSYDEKPLLLFQKLKDAKKNPVFMLKHIKDIRSPIAVAQQKQAARKANSETSSVKSPPLSGASGSSQAHGQGSGHAQSLQGAGRRPQGLQVNPHVGSVAPSLMSGVPGGSGQSAWPEVMSPSVEAKDRVGDEIVSGLQAAPGSSNGTDEGSQPSVVREIPPSTGVSYAVAIYPYMAEQEDEFDVVVYVISPPLSFSEINGVVQW